MLGVLICIQRTSTKQDLKEKNARRVSGLSTGDQRGLRIIRRASPRRGRSHTIDTASAMRDLPTHDESTQSIHPYLTTATLMHDRSTTSGRFHRSNILKLIPRPIDLGTNVACEREPRVHYLRFDNRNRSHQYKSQLKA